jgi:two-component system chemotaxis response regulator CheB
MLSAAEVYGKKVLGVIMTGMGNDGVRGLRELKEMGGSAMAESEQSCVVFGMPRAAINAGLVDEIHPADNIAAAIVRAVIK